ncbi:MAG: putative metalloprotease CJM1_0395 family protein, partial [Planctomycetota bacterium]
MSTLTNALFDRAAHSAPPALADPSRRFGVNTAAVVNGSAADPSNAPSAITRTAPTDTAEFSEAALRQYNRPGDVRFREEGKVDAKNNPADGPDANAPAGRDGEPLDESEQKQVEELQARDREVRQHEQAHKAAAGPYATSGPTYSYQEGPDGKRYAVGGSVGIDTSPEATPEETIAKMQVVRRAALDEVFGEAGRIAGRAARLFKRERPGPVHASPDVALLARFIPNEP